MISLCEFLAAADEVYNINKNNTIVEMSLEKLKLTTN